MSHKKTKVVVIAPNYRAGGLGGTQTYFDELIKRLVNSPELELTIICPKNQFNKGELSAKVLNFFPANRPLIGPLPALLKMYSKSFLKMIEKYDIAFLPLTASLNLQNFPLTTVVTLHDVQHLDLPKNFSLAERVYRYFTYDRQAKKANLIVTISNFSRQRIIEKLRVLPTKVKAIHIGVQVPSKIKLSSSSDDSYLIYPARSWPHKNHKRLFQAIRELDQEGCSIKLHLTGNPPEIPKDISHLVTDLGLLDYSNLMSEIANSKGLIFPSLYEGFGLPPLEAMALGCPIAVSNLASLPEICLEAAIYYDPESISEIKNSIKLLMFNDNSNRINLGLDIAKSLSWKNTSENYIKFFATLN